jgi:hypothetical protein
MNLAICLQEVGRSAEALAMMADAAERLARVLGEEHPHTLRCRANHAIIRAGAAGLSPVAEAQVFIDKLVVRLGAHHGAVLALQEGRLLRRVIDPHPF